MKKSTKEKMADKENMTISESDEALFNAKVRTAIKNGWNKKASITHTNKGIKFYEARFERDKKKEKGGKVDTQLQEMVEGYKEAILFSSNDYEDNPLDSNYSNSDFSPNTNEAIERMMKKFIEENAGTIESSGMDYAQVGRDIWYTQAGHGVGFFDRGLDKPIAERLTKSAKDAARFPQVEIDSDNTIRVRGVEKYEHGGKLRTPQEFNKLVAEKQRIVEKLSPKEIADMWNKNAYGVIKGASIPWTEEEAKKDTAKMYLRNLLVENELSEEEHEKYFQGGGEIPKSEFIKELQDKIQEIIPKSGVHVRVWKGLGQPSIYIQTTLGKDKSEYPNGIIDELGNPKEKMEVNSDSGFFFIKSTVPHLAYERIKTGWRNFSGNKEQVVKKIVDYFKKAKLILLENKDKLDDYAENLVEQKYSQDKMQKGGEVPIVKYKINRPLTNPEVEYLQTHGVVAEESYWKDADEENNNIKLSTSAGVKEKSKSEIEAIFKDALGSKKEYKGTVIEKMTDGGKAKAKKLNIGDAVYNKKENTIGIVRDTFEEKNTGDLRTDADGVVSTEELELYDENNPKHQKAHMAPSTKKELEGKNYVAIHESENGYWTIASKPTTMSSAQTLAGGAPRGEVGKVVTLQEAIKHDKVLGREYLYSTGGNINLSGPEKLQQLGIKTTDQFGDKYREWLDKVNKVNNNGEYVGYQISTSNNNIKVIGKKGTIDFEIEDFSDFPKSAKPMVATMVNYSTGGKLPKSAQVKKIEQQIAALEESMNSSLTSQFPELKDKMQKKIDDLKKLHKDLSVKVATKQKMDLENGKFYVEIPTSVKNELYLKLRDKGVKVKWKSLGESTRAIANNKAKQAKVYQIYSQILSRENKQVPAFETISGKLTR